jgi:alcohol dehydrogenase class IV
MGLGQLADGDTAFAEEVVLEKLDTMLDAAGAPRSHHSIGVKKEDLPELAKRALKDICILTSPRQANLQDLLALLERAY